MSKEAKINKYIKKARFWWAVLWVENLQEGWLDTLQGEACFPFAYCVHSKDLDTKDEARKDHIHIILAFPNTTTYNHAFNIFKIIAGEKAVNTCQPVLNIRHAYDYLIHDTDKCREDGKHQYAIEERITGNNFDIGSYEQVSQVDKDNKLKELRRFIRENNFLTVKEWEDAFDDVYLEAGDTVAFEVYKSYSHLLREKVKGNYAYYQHQRDVACAEQAQKEREEKWEQTRQSTEELNLQAQVVSLKAEIELLKEELANAAAIINEVKAPRLDFEDDFEDENSERGSEERIYKGHTTLYIRDGRRVTTAGQSVAENEDFSNSDDFLPSDTPQTRAQTHAEKREEFCPHCGSISVKKKGKNASGTQRFLCRDCGKSFTSTIGTEKRRE